jgi:hypothetical protein
MPDSNRKHTPASTMPLGTDVHGARFYEDWDYTLVDGTLINFRATRDQILSLQSISLQYSPTIQGSPMERQCLELFDILLEPKIMG